MGTHKLKINANSKKVTRDVDADEITAEIGDQVEWKLVGEAKDFSVDFAEGAPFSEPTKRESDANGKIEVTIWDKAKTGEVYNYNVGVDGASADPKIRIG